MPSLIQSDSTVSFESGWMNTRSLPSAAAPCGSEFSEVTSLVPEAVPSLDHSSVWLSPEEDKLSTVK